MMRPISGGLAYEFRMICKTLGIRDFEEEMDSDWSKQTRR